MGTRFLARLQFRTDGPLVEGEWARLKPAQDRYTEWVGLYSKDPQVTVRLIARTDSRERVLRSWTAQGETAL
ncbi:hypothetical protein ACWC24_36320 [Streptomyces sp. NPDC001443]